MVRLSMVVFAAVATIGCARTVPQHTAMPEPVPVMVADLVPSVESPELKPVGYRTEFGTMWTFDAPPLDYWKEKYAFEPDQQWLDRARIASVRLPNCSASFVSGNGLVMTNQHCIRECIVSASTEGNDYIETGFIARSQREEKQCEGMYIDQLESIENVTERVRAALTSGDPAEMASQRTAVVNAIQSECAERTGLTCQVVSLYAGGMYSVYSYRRIDDIRLVFGPEDAIAIFGGDPDNFAYPRYNLDMALLRAYVDGKPHAPREHFRWSRSGASEGEAVFVIGNPGSTGRLNTMAQMEYLRDISYPGNLAAFERVLDVIGEIQRQSPEAARESEGLRLDIENVRKAVEGYRAGLVDPGYMARKWAFEKEFRARIASNADWAARFGGSYEAIANAQREIASIAQQLRFHGYGPVVQAGGSRLLQLAGRIVRMTDQTRASLLADQPVDTLFERLTLAAHLRAARAALPADDPFVAAALGGRTPEQAAATLVSESRIADSEFRRALVEGGSAAIAASNDPLIVLAREIDPLNRAVQASFARSNAAITANGERIGQALFATYGTALPPDATFTLRISDGVASGYPMNGTVASWKTTLLGMYARSADFDGREPFHLSKQWKERMNRLDLTTPFNFVSTNDIIGGNSGSPIINRNAEVVGVVFDGNIENLANRFLFSTDRPRTISVHSSAVIEALRKVYDAPRIADELEGARR